MTNKGIDISVYQPKVDWKTLSADFVILRAGYGKLATQKDKCFEEHYSDAKANKVPVGAYWYSYAMTEDEAKQEAKACIEVLKGKQYEYPIYYDVEEQKQYALGKAKVSAIIKAFCSELEKAGYFVGLYTNAAWYNSVIDDDIKVRYSIWIAHWGVSKPGISGAYAMWQYKVGPVAGISGDVDQDYCTVDFPKIMQEQGFNGYSVQEELFNNNKDTDTVYVEIALNGATYGGELQKKK